MRFISVVTIFYLITKFLKHMKYITPKVLILFFLFSCTSEPNGNSNKSSKATEIPLAPSNLMGVLGSSSQINLTWIDNSPNESGFRIERRLEGGKYILVETVNENVLNYSNIELTENTNYSYRVIAYNEVGNSLTHSNEFSINTGRSPITTGDTTSKLSTVKIYNQIWMTKNLDVVTYSNGDVIPQVTNSKQWSNLTSGAWCYYNNDATNGAIYGKLYNLFAVNDPRGLAPIGWHIPSDAEWTVLTTSLGGDSIAAGKMKVVGVTKWRSPNSGADNSSGWSGLPGGFRYINGSFFNINDSGDWWSASEDEKIFASWKRTLYVNDINDGKIGRYKSSMYEGSSVRCLRN
jgi:uncharacterized protein (TIGR02145 family)